MMLEFLETYARAVSLDSPAYAHRFPHGKDKADFLLFRGEVICEVKEKRRADMPRQVERVWKKGSLAPQHVGRDVSRAIIKDLRDAARQIRDTREVLGLPDAGGLVVLENHVAETLSSAVFVAAADSEMQSGVPEIDCVLCLDFVNTFSRSEADTIRLAQLVCRPGARSERLSKRVDRPLLEDFATSSGIPLRRGHAVERLDQTWVTDRKGKFVRYEAKLDFAERLSPRAKIARTLRVVGKWSWIFGIGWAAGTLIIRGCTAR